VKIISFEQNCFPPILAVHVDLLEALNLVQYPDTLAPAPRLNMAAAKATQPAVDGEDRTSRLLARAFGHRSFRQHQAAAVAAVLAGSDSCVLLATGSGKSVCYQLPALCAGGLTLVLSPLLSLCQDQIEQIGNMPEPIETVAWNSDSKTLHDQIEQSLLDDDCGGIR
jgi:superfamily II DNA helicase RecQ